MRVQRIAIAIGTDSDRLYGVTTSNDPSYPPITSREIRPDSSLAAAVLDEPGPTPTSY